MSIDLFVYGTLVPGGRYYDVVARWVQAHRPAAVRGRLYDTGRGYPAASFTDGGEPVHGAVLTLAPADEALAALDDFEGPEYRRVEIGTLDGAAVVAYEWCAPFDGLVLVEDGRWLKDRAANGR